MNIPSKRLDDEEEDEDGIIICNRQYRNKGNKQRSMDAREMEHKKKKGYLKIHIAGVDVNTKEILSLEVTDEKVHDGKIMEQLVEPVLENKNKNKNKNKDFHIKSVLADGAYDSNKNFNYLQKKNIQPGIKVRKNSIISCKNNSKIRNREVDLR